MSLVVSLTDLRRQEGSHVHLSDKIPAPESFSTDLVKAVGELVLELDLQSVSEGVLITGTVQADVDSECARCLTLIEETITGDLGELAYYPERAKALLESGDEEAEDALIIKDDAVDIEPAVRDLVVSQMPFVPLCREDCEGLCSGCGEPLADLPEDHVHEEAPRELSPLDKLKAQLEAEQ